MILMKIELEYGIEVNIQIICNLFVNGDLGTYFYPYGYVGWGSNIGFRLGFKSIFIENIA